MSNTIIIRWRESREYLTIDFERLNIHPVINSTREVWDDNTIVTYNTTSKVESTDNGVVMITITYKEIDNLKIPSGARFGVSTISFKAPYKKGTAIWKDGKNSNWNGTCGWMRADEGIFKKKKPTHKIINSLERRQAQFRGLLLSIDGCCAITEERTVCSLEAAHIIPSKDGGNESKANGILLRADIHRLYDNGSIAIKENGKVTISKNANLSQYYCDLLKDAKVSREILDRISLALKELPR